MTTSWRNAQSLTGVPEDPTKVWKITRTHTNLLVACNDVTDLNFNFATDYMDGYSNCQSLWTRESKSISFNCKIGMYGNNNLLSIRTTGRTIVIVFKLIFPVQYLSAPQAQKGIDKGKKSASF